MSQPEPLPALRLDTTTLPKEQKFAVWSGALTGYDAAPLGPPDEFQAIARAWLLQSLVLTCSHLTPVRMIRTAGRIQGDGIDHISVVLQTQRSWRAQFGQTGRRPPRVLEARPGIAYILDLAMECDVASEGGEIIILQLPRAMMPMQGDMQGLALDHAMGLLFADYLRLLVHRLPALTEADAPSLAAAVLAMLAACVPRTAVEPSPAPTDVTRRLRRHIDANLDATLTMQTLAQALHMSRSSLYRALRPLNGIAAFVRFRRLVRIHTLLQDPAERRSLKELAHAHGFSSAAHLSRSFRHQYGCSMTEYRARAALAPADPAAPTGQQLRRWVAALE